MRRALRLAERGRGRVSPNPIVGAVVVRGGRVVGEGWHRGVGEPHAEAMALERAGVKARGATLYVTLEPCAHRGRTPPCADAIVRAQVARCVVALRDPHEVVNGRGLRRLRRAGIQVELGCLFAESRRALGGYWLAHTQGRPRVTLKLAASLDGRIAPRGGFTRRNRWLTGPEARRQAHRLRAVSDAVVVGAGTAKADDPRLTARGVRAARQPLRIVCDTGLALPLRLALFRGRLAPGTVVACGRRASARAQARLEARGVTVWRLPERWGRVSTRALFERLAREGRYEVLVEGGAQLANACLAEGQVDRIALFVAPRLLGPGGLGWGATGRSADKGRIVEQKKMGEDAYLMIEMER